MGRWRKGLRSRRGSSRLDGAGHRATVHRSADPGRMAGPTGYARPVPSDLDLRGVWVPLITPFDAAGAVDVAAIERLCHRALDAGAAGIVALGTTGESSALDDAERAHVVATVSKVCADRGSRVIVGTGSNNTAHTVAVTAALAGIPAVVGALVVVSYYVRPSEAGITTVPAAGLVPADSSTADCR